MKKTTFKFKDQMYSNGISVSDGQFIAPAECSIAWKCPSDETTAALVKREKFSYQCKTLSLNDCPDFEAMLAQRKEAKYKLEDTMLVHLAGEMLVHLFWSAETGLVGIDEKYYFLLQWQEVFAKDNRSPIFAEENIIVMPVLIDISLPDTKKYFS